MAQQGAGHNWQEDPLESGQIELVGDWSRVAGPKGLREPWGFVFPEFSLVTDFNHPPIPSENNQIPHIGSPVVLVADSLNNRIIRAEFNGKSTTFRLLLLSSLPDLMIRGIV